MHLVRPNTLFQQPKRWLYIWTSPGGQYWRWRSSIQSEKTRPGTDCGSDHELRIATCTLKLNKVQKTTRPFRCGLNQIPYDYTVEVTNRFKRLDLRDTVGWKAIWKTTYKTVRWNVIKQKCCKHRLNEEKEYSTGKAAQMPASELD